MYAAHMRHVLDGRVTFHRNDFDTRREALEFQHEFPWCGQCGRRVILKHHNRRWWLLCERSPMHRSLNQAPGAAAIWAASP